MSELVGSVVVVVVVVVVVSELVGSVVVVVVVVSELASSDDTGSLSPVEPSGFPAFIIIWNL